MPKRLLEHRLTTALAAIALVATALALYVQVFEARSRQEEARLSALRLERGLAESRARLKAEILAEIRNELRGELPGTAASLRPLPNTILRRGEPEEATSGNLQQAADPLRSRTPISLAGVDNRLRSLAQRSEEADRALRQDLEELRATTRLESEISRRATSLVLVALIPLVIALFLAGRQGAVREKRAENET
jgi:hypothetical protein